MRMLVTGVAVSLAVAASTPSRAQAPETSTPRIEISDCQKRVAAGTAVVIDVRDAASYERGHIAGALNVPLDTVGQRADELKKKGRAIVAYCA
jgi:3-mercaptopyruvate sulfurtransferase SseA